MTTIEDLKMSHEAPLFALIGMLWQEFEMIEAAGKAIMSKWKECAKETSDRQTDDLFAEMIARNNKMLKQKREQIGILQTFLKVPKNSSN